MGFHKTDNHINAFLLQTTPFDKHLPRFPNPGSITEVNLQLPAL
jgi:hypothetical protein